MTIHIVGLAVRIGNQKRQRCAWCGEVLLDDDLTGMYSPDVAEPGHFEAGSFVQVEGTQQQRCISVLAIAPNEQVPAGFCGDAERPRLKLVPPEGGAE